MSERWPGGLISKTPVTPSGPAPTSTAPGIWTIDQMNYWKARGLWPDASADPYWSYVSYLMSTTATNTQTNNTFLDSSTNNFTITRNGNTTQGSVTPYGPLWSNYFDGSGDYLSVAYNTAFNVPGNFTVEAWVYQTSRSATQSVVNRSGVSGSQFSSFELIMETNGTVTFVQGSGTGTTGTQAVVTSSTTTTLNTWVHIAGVRNGSTITLYINGVQAATGAAGSNDANTTSPVLVGTRGAADFNFSGYISNLRIVKGTAVYTAAFTPPTAPVTAISGTSLLTCQNNRFIDNSTNAFAITANGDTKVTAFSPFVLAPPGYTTATNGGSGYFDGSGDYLTTSTSVLPTTGDFTAETWFNQTTSANTILVYLRGGTGSYAALRIGCSAGGIYLLMALTDGTWTVNSGVISTVVLNMWNHVAVVRSGGTITMYLNGVSIYSTTAIGSGSALMAGASSEIGRMVNGATPDYFAGYMSNLRVVTSAVYTAAFTPPTAPVTAITNTSLLLNFTNGGIYDASMNSNMETVGNTQVSSTQAKYGTTSAYFDGTGDVLTMPTSPVFSFGTGDFTIECWLYFTSYGSANQNIIDFRGSAGSGSNIALYLENVGGTGTKQLRAYDGTGDAAVTASNFPLNTWSHVAITRSSNSFRFFVNGTQVGSTTTVTTNYSNTAGLYVGAYAGNVANFYGYIDDLRVTKGYARYTANFTPPTAALPVY